eukprot:scaffold54690_cov69-Cyclotella_meneghiniana.AAC.1
MENDEINNRRREELEALSAYYGNDLSATLPTNDDSNVPLDGPWFLRIRNQDESNAIASDHSNNNSSSLGVPTLEIRLPPSYPMGDTPPTPILHNIMMNPTKKDEFLKELVDMYESYEVAILWGEKCREELLSSSDIMPSECSEHENIEATINTESKNNLGMVRTFIPPSTKYSQPTRHFPIEVIENPAYKRDITRTPPFHPPKSGPSETMIAHICSVYCMEHVHWVLATLLFGDKKVARATHNMFAYRFMKDGILVSDNDDDGEKGSGAKLASLLQLSKVEDVMVIVSRWYGGTLLGPARFKHIASVARDGLVQAGFLSNGG